MNAMAQEGLMDDLTGIGQARVSSDRSWTTDTLLVHLKALLDSEHMRINDALDTERRRTMMMAEERDRRYLTLYEERDLRYQQRFEAQSAAIADALQAADRAVTKAEIATEKRFESVNEFRATLTDQAGTFMSRVEYEAQARADRDRLTEITRRLDRAEGKSTGLDAGWGYLVGVIGALGGLVAVVIALANV